MYTHVLPISTDEVVWGTGHVLAMTVSIIIRGPTSSVTLSTPPATMVYVSSHSSKPSVTVTISLVIEAESENIKRCFISYLVSIIIQEINKIYQFKKGVTITLKVRKHVASYVAI